MTLSLGVPDLEGTAWRVRWVGAASEPEPPRREYVMSLSAGQAPRAWKRQGRGPAGDSGCGARWPAPYFGAWQLAQLVAAARSSVSSSPTRVSTATWAKAVGSGMPTSAWKVTWTTVPPSAFSVSRHSVS